jgi:predicted RNA-binding protein YlqC (UPF0109 family)
MKDLLEYIVKNLVSNPEAVLIEQSGTEGEINLLLTVDPADMGLIIGKNGQTIHAIRRLLTVRAIAEQVRINLQLSEPEGGESKESTDTEESDEAAQEPKTEETTESEEVIEEKLQEEKSTE